MPLIIKRHKDLPCCDSINLLGSVISLSDTSNLGGSLMEITFNCNREIDFYLERANITIDPLKKELFVGGFISRPINTNDEHEVARHYKQYINNSPINIGLKEGYDFREIDIMPILAEITSRVMQQDIEIQDVLNLWEDDKGVKLLSYVNVEPEK